LQKLKCFESAKYFGIVHNWVMFVVSLFGGTKTFMTFCNLIDLTEELLTVYVSVKFSNCCEVCCAYDISVFEKLCT